MLKITTQLQRQQSACYCTVLNSIAHHPISAAQMSRTSSCTNYDILLGNTDTVHMTPNNYLVNTKSYF